MAHNINFNDQTGKHSFFSVQQKAWHGLGQIVEGYPTSKEALQLAGLNYTVEKRKLYTPDGGTINFEGEREYNEIEVPNYFATVRADNDEVLGVVGNEYQIVQNAEAFNFFDAIVDGEGILYETAGALGKGEKVFITAKLPDYIRVGKDDCIEKYIFLTTSHDGSGSIMAAFTPIRIVCQNTLNAALRNCSNVVKIRHTITAADKLKEAHKVMGIANRLSEQMEEIFNHWAKVQITDKQVLKLIQQAMAPSKEVLDNLKNGIEVSTAFTNIYENTFHYAMSSPTQQSDTTRGTLFGAFNAVTGYFQNVKEFKDDDTKVKSILLGGTGQQRMQTAFNICTDFAQHGADALVLN